MSFPVAVQSAVFYVVSCMPCMAARGRWRTRQQTKRDRRERARRDEEEPDLYRHPSPFNMNPYWEEDMVMGPSLRGKKGRGGVKDTGPGKLASAGKASSETGSSSGLASSGMPASAATPAPAAAAGEPTDGPVLELEDARSVSGAGSATASSTDGWNHKRYQREDEELWGHGAVAPDFSRAPKKLMDAIVKAGSSAGRLLESTLGMADKDREKDEDSDVTPRAVTEEERARFYGVPAIHPPVNDYHPPVVMSMPANRDALKWMLQPPPPAKVMEGKVPVSRSASMTSSIGRRTAAGSDVSLSRRMAEGKSSARRSKTLVDKEGLPAPSPGRSASRRSTASPRTRSRSLSSEASSEGTTKKGSRRRRAHRPAVTPEVESDDERDDYFRHGAEPTTHVAQRPKLETILSSDASSRHDFATGISSAKENVSLNQQLSDGVASGEKEDVRSNPSSPRERLAGPSIDSGLALSN